MSIALGLVILFHARQEENYEVNVTCLIRSYFGHHTTLEIALLSKSLDKTANVITYRPCVRSIARERHPLRVNSKVIYLPEGNFLEP